MSANLSAVRWQFVLVYLDNIVVFWKSLKANIVHVRNLATLLSDAGANFKLTTFTSLQKPLTSSYKKYHRGTLKLHHTQQTPAKNFNYPLL